MKNLGITIVLLLAGFTAFAQINGKGNLEERSFNLEEVYRVEAGMYADITVDMSMKAGITIEAQPNLFDHIGRSVKNGVLVLDQKKWIEPTERITIIVGAPELREVYMGTHDKLKVRNVTGDLFKVYGELGTTMIEGMVDEVRIKSESGVVDAKHLVAKTADVEISEDGHVMVNAAMVDCDISEDGSYSNEQRVTSGCDQVRKEITRIDTRYIDLQIKNNSWTRKHFVVIGPKPDGRKFSYGFSMMPGAKKSERWTIGSKIYSENRFGKRKLLATITAADEGQVRSIFE